MILGVDTAHVPTSSKVVSNVVANDGKFGHLLGVFSRAMLDSEGEMDMATKVNLTEKAMRRIPSKPMLERLGNRNIPSTSSQDMPYLANNSSTCAL